MQLKIALAGALRALRLSRRFRYEQLSDAGAKSKISALERAETSITLEKFESLAQALEISPLTLLALCMSVRLDTPYSSLIDQTREQLRAFDADGGLGLLAEQFANGELVQRPRGKPGDTETMDAVNKLKESGMTQARIAEELGLSPTTVSRHWKRILDKESNGG